MEIILVLLALSICPIFGIIGWYLDRVLKFQCAPVYWFLGGMAGILPILAIKLIMRVYR